MSATLQGGALLCTVLGLVAALAVGLRTRDVRLATGVLLEFLLAAGLLRLADDPRPQALLTAVVVVALRRLVSAGLRAGVPRRLPAVLGRSTAPWPWGSPIDGDGMTQSTRPGRDGGPYEGRGPA